MKNLAFHSSLRWKMIYSTNSHYLTYTFHFERLGECTFELGSERVNWPENVDTLIRPEYRRRVVAHSQADLPFLVCAVDLRTVPLGCCPALKSVSGWRLVVWARRRSGTTLEEKREKNQLRFRGTRIMFSLGHEIGQTSELDPETKRMKTISKETSCFLENL